MIGITTTFTRAVTIDTVSFSAFAGSEQDNDNLTRRSAGMCVACEQMPAVMQGYMEKMESRIANIEVLLHQLVELQKSNSDLTIMRREE